MCEHVSKGHVVVVDDVGRLIAQVAVRGHLGVDFRQQRLDLCMYACMRMLVHMWRRL